MTELFDPDTRVLRAMAKESLGSRTSTSALWKAARQLVSAQSRVGCGCGKPRPNLTYHNPACKFRMACHMMVELALEKELQIPPRATRLSTSSERPGGSP